MKAPVIDDFSALIGIDWADKKHGICELKVGSKKYDYSLISSNPTAYRIIGMLGSCSMSIKSLNSDASDAGAG